MVMRFNLIQKEKCMVMKMNKKEFIEELQNELKCEENKAIIINNTLEENFFLSKKSKEKNYK